MADNQTQHHGMAPPAPMERKPSRFAKIVRLFSTFLSPSSHLNSFSHRFAVISDLHLHRSPKKSCTGRQRSIPRPIRSSVLLLATLPARPCLPTSTRYVSSNQATQYDRRLTTIAGGGNRSRCYPSRLYWRHILLGPCQCEWLLNVHSQRVGQHGTGSS
jgi:hypothetical protein